MRHARSSALPSIVSVPLVSSPPIDAGREPGGDEAQRRLARLVRRRRARRSRRRRARRSTSWRTGVGVARHTGSSRPQLEPEHQRIAGKLPGDPQRDGRDERGQQERPGDALAPCVGHRQSRCRRPGPAERADLERQAALLDLGQRGEDDRPHERQHAAESRADAALGVEARERAGLRRSLPRVRPSPARPRASRARRTRTAATARAARDRSTKAARVGRQANRPIDSRDGEQADERLGREVDALDASHRTGRW